MHESFVGADCLALCCTEYVELSKAPEFTRLENSGSMFSVFNITCRSTPK